MGGYIYQCAAAAGAITTSLHSSPSMCSGSPASVSKQKHQRRPSLPLAVLRLPRQQAEMWPRFTPSSLAASSFVARPMRRSTPRRRCSSASCCSSASSPGVGRARVAIADPRRPRVRQPRADSPTTRQLKIFSRLSSWPKHFQQTRLPNTKNGIPKSTCVAQQSFLRSRRH